MKQHYLSTMVLCLALTLASTAVAQTSGRGSTGNRAGTGAIPFDLSAPAFVSF